MENDGYSRLVRTNPDYKNLGHFLYDRDARSLKEKILALKNILSKCEDYPFIAQANSELYYWALNEGYRKETDGNVYIHSLSK